MSPFYIRTVNPKLLNLILLLTSMIGYLEWGKGNHSFLIQSEIDVFAKLFTDPVGVLHPLIIIPLIGQILLIITLFQKNPVKILTLTGMISLGLLLLLMLFIGIITMNFKIIASTLPFVITGIFTIINLNKLRKKNL